jgi:NAD(P)-dependent dehydrogenase (short-subunit alcohol dehydrogenase family)
MTPAPRIVPPDSAPPSVLVTGASKGIGRATASLLAGVGYRVFAGVRTAADGEALRAETSDRLIPVLLDVTDTSQIRAAYDLVQHEVGDGGLQGVVNNAGIVVAGPLEGMPLDDIRHQMEVNLIGPLAVIQTFLSLVRHGAGRIVNVSSINGRIAVPFVGPYAASKFALEAASDALRMELRRWGIPVIVIEPGAIDTPIWDTAQRNAGERAQRYPDHVRQLYGGLKKMTAPTKGPPKHALAPQRVARLVHRCLTTSRPRTRYVIGRDARIGAFVRALLPDKMMDRLLLARR